MQQELKIFSKALASLIDTGGKSFSSDDMLNFGLDFFKKFKSTHSASEIKNLAKKVQAEYIAGKQDDLCELIQKFISEKNYEGCLSRKSAALSNLKWGYFFSEKKRIGPIPTRSV